MSDTSTNPDVVESQGDATYRVTANELRQFVERIERLDAEKKDLESALGDAENALELEENKLLKLT